MEERKVLNQEEFEEEIKAQYGNKFICLNGYILDGIEINDRIELCINCAGFIFTDCDIKNISIDIYYHRLIVGGRFSLSIEFRDCIIDTIETNTLLRFYACRFINYEKVKFYYMHGYGDFGKRQCTFDVEPPMACPKEGKFVGYKICATRRKGGGYKRCIVKLLIPSDAKRSSGFSNEVTCFNKCRCSKAKVLGIYDTDGNKYKSRKSAKSFLSPTKDQIIYKVGRWVYPDSFGENRFEECSHGIHFFMTFDEAKEY